MDFKVKLSFKKKIEKKVLPPSAIKNEAAHPHKHDMKQAIDSFDKNLKRFVFCFIYFSSTTNSCL